MPYINVLASLLFLLAIAYFALEIFFIFRPRKWKGDNLYMLAKERLENDVVIYTLERYRSGGLFFAPAAQTMVLKRTFDDTEAQRWVEMFSPALEDRTAK